MRAAAGCVLLLVLGCDRAADESGHQGEPVSSSPPQPSASVPAGSATTMPSAKPRAKGVIDVQVGANHSFALYADGSVKAWGSDQSGAMGIKGTHTRPTSAPSLKGLKQISTNQAYSCGVFHDGLARCWGRSYRGALGSPGSTEHLEPERVATIDKVVEVKVGNTSLARLVDGSVYSWGGIVGRSDQPSLLKDVPKSVGLAQGGFPESSSSCSWTAAGQLTCWGTPFAETYVYGNLVAGGDSGIYPPRPVEGVRAVVAMDISASHGCTAHRDGSVACWGRGNVGQLGDGKAGPGWYRKKPFIVPELSDVVDVAVGMEFSCALSRQHELHCWGRNGWGQLGLGDKQRRLRPEKVSGLSGVRRISAGFDHACALTRRGRVYCWGRGFEGQLGLGQEGVQATRTTPTEVPLGD